MSGAFSIPNTFASAVTATGAQLDANYNTITAYINDPTNRNNYAADTGSTNTVAIAFTPAVVGGYTAGLEITFKAAFTNTGAVVVNANTLGNQNLVNPDGSVLVAGQVVAGSVYKAAYDGTRFIFLTGYAIPASQAQMQTATSAITFVSPGEQKYHPLHPKAWAVIDGTATGTVITTVGVGISSHIRMGTGSYAVVLSSPFANANYGVSAFVRFGGAGSDIQEGGRSTATCTLLSFATTTGVAGDVSTAHVFIWGTLP